MSSCHLQAHRAKSIDALDLDMDIDMDMDIGTGRDMDMDMLNVTSYHCCDRDIMLEGGTAVDAAVGGMVCNGVFTTQSAGLGGGFLMVVHDGVRHSGTTVTLNAREAAPGSATRDMFKSCSKCSQHGAKGRCSGNNANAKTRLK